MEEGLVVRMRHRGNCFAYILIAVLLCLFLSSCSTPADENPVSIAPVEVPHAVEAAPVSEPEIPETGPDPVLPEAEEAEPEEEPVASEAPAFSGSSLLGTVPYDHDDTDTVLTASFWETGEKRALLEEAIRLYESLNPGIRIKAEFIDPEGYWSNISADAAGGRLSDIVEMDRRYIGQFISRSLIEDLSGFWPGFEGYGLPMGLDADVMAYRSECIESAGISIPGEFTLESVLCTGEAVYECTGLMTDTSLDMGVLEAISVMQGSSIFEDIAEGNTEPALKYFSLVSQLAALPFASFSGGVEEWNRFTSAADIRDGERAVAVSPRIEPYALLSVSSSSGVKTEAERFLFWLLASDEAGSILRIAFGIPLFRSIDSGNLSPLERLQFRTVLDEDGQPDQEIPPAGYAELSLLLSRFTLRVWKGEMMPDEAAAAFCSEAAGMLERAAT